ncbi:MAG: DUF3999 family protein [Stagnimonas sp.]|nr:DUF3999 family protein [Stagnimonas sp.]
MTQARSIQTKVFAVGLWLMALPAIAAEALQVQQFAEAIPLTAEANHPVQQVQLPDAVYQRVVSPTLNDVAVFDATGVAVPHVFCAVPNQQSVTETQQPLTVFPVQLARAGAQGTTAQVHTDTGSSIAITVPGDAGAQATVGVAAYDLDLSALTAPAVALQVQWHSPTGLSEVHVKVEQQDSAQQWQTVVADAVLKRVTADGQTLERADIALPVATYKSLRLTPRDAEGTVIDAVQVRTRTISALPADLHWFTAVQSGPAEDVQPAANAAATQGYDTLRQAPVTLAQIKLVAPNTRYDLRLQSRRRPQAAWQTVWAGEAFYVVTAAGERRNAEIALPANHDRYWRLVADAANAPFTPILKLAYTPQNLRFVAQGQGPYRLAYGNASAVDRSPSASCEGLLKTLLQTTGSSENLIGTAESGALQVLAGAAALQAPPPVTAPAWRRWLLWGVLGVAVLLLLGMARKLLADLNTST